MSGSEAHGSTPRRWPMGVNLKRTGAVWPPRGHPTVTHLPASGYPPSLALGHVVTTAERCDRPARGRTQYLRIIPYQSLIIYWRVVGPDQQAVPSGSSIFIWQ